MEYLSLISTIFVCSILLSITIYSIYTGFGPNSKSLKDPFQGHED